MKYINNFLDSIDELLSEKSFIRSHTISPKDHTRNRQLTFKKTWYAMFSHTGMSLMSEMSVLSSRFDDPKLIVSPQAFSKARNKISHTACIEIFKKSVHHLHQFSPTYKGYHLAAVDGSNILTPDNPEIRKALGTSKNHFSERAGAGISILYDPLSDFIINGKIVHINTPERTTMMELVAEHPLDNTILLLDRGYPGKKIFHFLEDKNLKYIIRMQIGPTNAKYIRNATLEDQIVTDEKDPSLKQRVIRIHLKNGMEELLVSNLLDPKFTVQDFKKLYHLRWPVETKYDELKNKLMLEKFSGKSLNSVYQDFYNTLTKSNLIAYFRYLSKKNIEKSKGHPKKIAIQTSIKMLQQYIPKLLVSKDREYIMETICKILKKMLIPIRNGRIFSRKEKHTRQKYRSNLK